MSTDTIFACGCVLRSSLQYSVRGNARSSAKRVAPVTFATASTFRIAFPMILCPAMDHLPHALGRELDGFGCEEKRGSTVAALGGAEVCKGFLEGVQLPVPGHSLDGAHRAPVAREPQHQT